MEVHFFVRPKSKVLNSTNSQYRGYNADVYSIGHQCILGNSYCLSPHHPIAFLSPDSIHVAYATRSLNLWNLCPKLIDYLYVFFLKEYEIIWVSHVMMMWMNIIKKSGLDHNDCESSSHVDTLWHKFVRSKVQLHVFYKQTGNYRCVWNREIVKLQLSSN